MNSVIDSNIRETELKISGNELKDQKDVNFTNFVSENFNKIEGIVENQLKNNNQEITTVLQEAVKISIPVDEELIEKTIIDEKIDLLRELYIFNTKLQVLIKNKKEIALLNANKKYDDLARKYDVKYEQTDELCEKYDKKIKEARHELMIKCQKLLQTMKISLEELSAGSGENSKIDIDLIGQLLEDLEKKSIEYKEKIIYLSEELENLKDKIKTIDDEEVETINSIEKQIANKEEKLEKYQNKLYDLYEEKTSKFKQVIADKVNFLTRSTRFLRRDWQALKKIVHSSSSFLVIHQRIIEHFKDPRKTQSAIIFVTVTIYAILLETVIQLGKSTAIGILAMTAIKSAVEALLSKAKAEDKAKGIGPEAEAVKLKIMNERVKKFKEEHLNKLNELLKNPHLKSRKSLKYFNHIADLNLITLTKKIDLTEKKQIGGFDNIDTLSTELIISEFNRKSKLLKSEVKSRISFYTTLQELSTTRSSVERLLRQNARTPMPKIFADQYNLFKTTYVEINKKYQDITNSEKNLQEEIIGLHDKITNDLSNRKILKKIKFIIDSYKINYSRQSINSLMIIQKNISTKTNYEIMQDLLQIHSIYSNNNQKLLNEYKDFLKDITDFNDKLDEHSWFSKSPQIIED